MMAKLIMFQSFVTLSQALNQLDVQQYIGLRALGASRSEKEKRCLTRHALTAAGLGQNRSTARRWIDGKPNRELEPTRPIRVMPSFAEPIDFAS